MGSLCARHRCGLCGFCLEPMEALSQSSGRGRGYRAQGDDMTSSRLQEQRVVQLGRNPEPVLLIRTSVSPECCAQCFTALFSSPSSLGGKCAYYDRHVERRGKKRKKQRALERGSGKWKSPSVFLLLPKILVLEAESHPMMVHLVASGVLSGWDEQMKS